MRRVFSGSLIKRVFNQFDFFPRHDMGLGQVLDIVMSHPTLFWPDYIKKTDFIIILFYILI